MREPTQSKRNHQLCLSILYSAHLEWRKEDAMNLHRTRIALRRSATAAALAVVVAASAVNAQTPTYTFKIIRFDTSSATERSITVELVDASNRQPVTNAQVDVVHTVYAANPKTFPPLRRVVVPLKPDGQGGYVYSDEGLRPGNPVRLRARLPGQSSPIWGAVHVND